MNNCGKKLAILWDNSSVYYIELRIPKSGLPLGVVKLWFEINETTSDAANLAPMNITSKKNLNCK
jgi:hypothetical protein